MEHESEASAAYFKGQRKAKALLAQLNMTAGEQQTAVDVAEAIFKLIAKMWAREEKGTHARIIVAKAAVAVTLIMADVLIETDAGTTSDDEGMAELKKKFSAL